MCNSARIFRRGADFLGGISNLRSYGPNRLAFRHASHRAGQCSDSFANRRAYRHNRGRPA